MSHIIYTKEAEKFLKKQPLNVSNRIMDAIEKLPFGDVKKMKGMEFFRLRVGKYRVIFDKNGVVITIISIDSRGQIYK